MPRQPVPRGFATSRYRSIRQFPDCRRPAQQYCERPGNVPVGFSTDLAGFGHCPPGSQWRDVPWPAPRAKKQSPAGYPGHFENEPAARWAELPPSFGRSSSWTIAPRCQVGVAGPVIQATSTATPTAACLNTMLIAKKRWTDIPMHHTRLDWPGRLFRLAWPDLADSGPGPGRLNSAVATANWRACLTAFLVKS